MVDVETSGDGFCHRVLDFGEDVSNVYVGWGEDAVCYADARVKFHLATEASASASASSSSPRPSGRLALARQKPLEELQHDQRSLMVLSP